MWIHNWEMINFQLAHQTDKKLVSLHSLTPMELSESVQVMRIWLNKLAAQMRLHLQWLTFHWLDQMAIKSNSQEVQRFVWKSIQLNQIPNNACHSLTLQSIHQNGNVKMNVWFKFLLLFGVVKPITLQTLQYYWMVVVVEVKTQIYKWMNVMDQLIISLVNGILIVYWYFHWQLLLLLLQLHSLLLWFM